MATVRAQKWAYFLKRLGFPNSKASIMDYVDSASDDEIWKQFISSNPCALEACKESKITEPKDIDWLFDQISYATMRSSFPANSHGRRPIGPKIVPMEKKANAQDIAKKTSLPEQSGKFKKAYLPLSDDFVGRRMMHTSLGEGVVVRIKEGNRIVIRFDSCGEKILTYDFCIGSLEFI